MAELEGLEEEMAMQTPTVAAPAQRAPQVATPAADSVFNFPSVPNSRVNVSDRLSVDIAVYVKSFFLMRLPYSRHPILWLC
jgi:hypothetical protein